jgi:hypothetical protein
MTSRRKFVTLLGAAVAATVAASSQQIASPPPIGVLLVGVSPDSAEAKQFRLGLRDVDYSESRHVGRSCRRASTTP